MISIKMRLLAGVAALLVQAGCSVTQRAPQDSIKETGFLTDYSQLTATTNTDLAAKVYVDKTANWASYSKVRLEPVTFWAGSDSKVPADVQQRLTDFAYQQLTQQFKAKGFQLVTTTGPGVMVVRVALTDATSATPGLRTISVVVPQAIILSNATAAIRGKPSFSGSAETEGEVLDGQSGLRIAAWVDRRVGGNSIENANVWEWGDAENAIKRWAERIAMRAEQLKTGQSVPF
jgi:Protein of unknown function (DUF3313)